MMALNWSGFYRMGKILGLAGGFSFLISSLPIDQNKAYSRSYSGPGYSRSFPQRPQGRKAYVDPAALNECMRAQDSYWASQCIEAIYDKRYTKKEIKYCASFDSMDDTTDCFNDYGRWAHGKQTSALPEALLELSAFQAPKHEKAATYSSARLFGGKAASNDAPEAEYTSPSVQESRAQGI